MRYLAALVLCFVIVSVSSADLTIETDGPVIVTVKTDADGKFIGFKVSSVNPAKGCKCGQDCKCGKDKQPVDDLSKLIINAAKAEAGTSKVMTDMASAIYADLANKALTSKIPTWMQFHDAAFQSQLGLLKGVREVVSKQLLPLDAVMPGMNMTESVENRGKAQAIFQKASIALKNVFSS